MKHPAFYEVSGFNLRRRIFFLVHYGRHGQPRFMRIKDCWETDFSPFWLTVWRANGHIHAGFSGVHCLLPHFGKEVRESEGKGRAA